MQTFKEKKWDNLKESLAYFSNFVLIPYIRRIIRFFALPYCYFYMVNWEECKAGRLQVASDFLYIFFVLKYFPDNYSVCRFWEKSRREWSFYYGSNYDPFQRRQLRKFVQKKEHVIIFEDKDICYQLCRANEFPLPVQIGRADNKKLCVELLNEYFQSQRDGKIIIKPVGGSAGSDILLAWQENNLLKLKNNNDLYDINSMPFCGPAVLQEVLIQHHVLDQLVSTSVNTIRIVTMLGDNDNVIFLGAYIRFGVGGSFLDNTSQGGVPVNIDIQKGCLAKYGFDFSTKKHTQHPDTGVVFEGINIPLWQDVLKLAKKIQRCFYFHKLMGHDIAITENGPVIIELNSIYDNVGLERSCGPILQNDAVLKQYMKYNLLINKKQVELYNLLVG
ncbi:hypothetical protein GMJAKD_15455 [Candidatus Electrothrix aarhusensis]